MMRRTFSKGLRGIKTVRGQGRYRADEELQSEFVEHDTNDVDGASSRT